METYCPELQYLFLKHLFFRGVLIVVVHNLKLWMKDINYAATYYLAL